MKARRQAKGEKSWEFDGKTITVSIPMTFVRRGGRKVIITPHGRDAWVPPRPRPDEALIRALVRAHRWRRLLEQGKYQSVSELSEAEGLTRSFINRLVRITLLAPDIQEAILDGIQPKGMQLEEVTDAISREWEKQRKALLSDAGLAEVGRFSPRPDLQGGRKRTCAGFTRSSNVFTRKARQATKPADGSDSGTRRMVRFPA